MARAVREARAPDRYLMSDGLDATTVTADLHDFTRSLARFRSNVPGYKEDLTGYPNSVQDRRHPADLIADLRGGLRSQADQLQRDVQATTVGIHASAELRQAVANTLVQRRLQVLTIIGVVIAVIRILQV
jgi:hypothetical protein